MSQPGTTSPAPFKTIRTIPQERTAMPEQPPRERVKNFSEVALGYRPEHARLESSRCLLCADPRWVTLPTRAP